MAYLPSAWAKLFKSIGINTLWLDEYSSSNSHSYPAQGLVVFNPHFSRGDVEYLHEVAHILLWRWNMESEDLVQLELDAWLLARDLKVHVLGLEWTEHDTKTAHYYLWTYTRDYKRPALLRVLDTALAA